MPPPPPPPPRDAKNNIQITLSVSLFVGHDNTLSDATCISWIQRCNAKYNVHRVKGLVLQYFYCNIKTRYWNSAFKICITLLNCYSIKDLRYSITTVTFTHKLVIYLQAYRSVFDYVVNIKSKHFFKYAAWTLVKLPQTFGNFIFTIGFQSAIKRGRVDPELN